MFFSIRFFIFYKDKM